MRIGGKLSSLVKYASELIIRSLFIYGDMESRHVPVILNLTLLLTQVVLVNLSAVGSLIALFSTLLTYVFRGASKVLKYASILASIPTIWYFITSLPFTLSVVKSLAITVNVFTLSLATLAFLYFINPIELAYLMNRLKLKEVSLYPVLTWKAVPHILKDLKTALTIASMKNVELWRGLAITVVTVEEYSQFYEEAQHAKGVFQPKYWYSWRDTAITACLVMINLTAIYLLKLCF
ncbi:MAG: hypothetical protein B7O98_03920 [Zestosphaera tikiterensis]|uniref:Cobalt ABC transporter permease n=1 Tax=Zestosphaera tikiterensis TaxID=1973259 RepID=A0A2R7Y7R3_9CREN|nr:MAG: hypothetical protein B7O98_03920 [Zestosphaera tikiterensis]